MNCPNEKTLKKGISNKEFFLNEFKKLDFSINNASNCFEQNNLKSKFNNGNQKQLTINDNNNSNEYNEIMNKKKEMEIKRLNILKLFDDDSLSQFFTFKQAFNENSKNGIEYTENFNDSYLTKESIFYFFNDFNQNDINKEELKLLNSEEIKDSKKNKIDLNFGEEPMNIYYKMITTKKKDKEKSLKLFTNYMLNLNKFIIKEQNIIIKDNKLVFKNEDESSNLKNELSLLNNDIIENSYNNNSLIYPSNDNKNFNHLIIPKTNNSNFANNNNIQNKKGVLIKPILVGDYHQVYTNNTFIKKEIYDKYKNNINKVNLEKIIKENKFELKHKKCLFKRKFVKKNNNV
jgi:hypothetical protein